MAVVHGIDALEPSLGRLLIVVGVFDGLHLGHAYLLDQLVQAAARLRARPAVITFDHHPDEILTGHAPPLLCDPDERLDRLAADGVEVTIVQHFDVALRTTPFDEFVRRIAEGVELAGFLMTPDSAFGYQRGGTPDTVAALGRELGYEVVVVPSFSLDEQPVSSAAIRAAIASGDFATAERLLGRPYSVVGLLGPVGVDAPSRAEPAELAFEMPVALPPDGRYRTLLAVDEAAARPAWADLVGGSLRVSTPEAAPVSGLATVTFHAP